MSLHEYESDVCQGNVLVVDDDPSILLMLSHLLSAHGYSVIGAQGGQAAIRCVHGRWMPDVVITDWDILDMDGGQLCDALRELPTCNDLSVVLISGRSDLPDLAQDMEVDAYLQKPFALANLLTAIQYVIGEAADRRQQSSLRII